MSAVPGARPRAGGAPSRSSRGGRAGPTTRTCLPARRVRASRIAATRVHRRAAVRRRRLRRVPQLPARARGAPPQRVRPSSPRAATSTWTRSARRSGTPASRTAPEPGRKVFVIREADRLLAGGGRHAAEGAGGAPGRRGVPPDVRARARAARHGAVAAATSSRSPRCRSRSWSTSLVREGVPEERARLAARLAGGNLGRARRLAVTEGRAAVPRRRARGADPRRRRARPARWRPPTSCSSRPPSTARG